MVAPAPPATNVAAIVGLVVGLVELLAAGLGMHAVPGLLGVAAFGCGITGDILSRRGYAGKRMGVAAVVLGLVCLAVAFGR